MKSCEEMTRNVRERGEAEIMARKKRRSVLINTAAGTAVICAAAGFVIMGGNSDKPEVSNAPMESIVFSGESITECTTETVHTEASEPAEEVIKPLTKDQLYYKCLNTVEYLTQISGSVRTLYGKNDVHIFEGEFQLDYIADKYHANVNFIAVDASIGDSDKRHECYNNGTVMVEVIERGEDSSLEDAFNVYEDGMCPSVRYATINNSCPVAPEDAEEGDITSIDQLGIEQLPSAGFDPSGTHEIAVVYAPNEMTSGYLRHFEYWDITGIQEMYGRQCAVVEGTSPPDYGNVFGVESFKMLIDQATGVWLWFEGYDADGNVEAYVYTEDVRFGDEAEEVPEYEGDINEPPAATEPVQTDVTEEAVQTETAFTETAVTTSTAAVTITTAVSSSDEAFLTSGYCEGNVYYELNEAARTLHFCGNGSDVDVSAALPLVGKFDTVIIDKGITSFKAVPENHLFGMSGSLTIYCSSDFNTIRLQRLLGEYLTFVILDE